MRNQTSSTLLQASVVEATARNILKQEVNTLLLDIRKKGKYEIDKDSIYLLAAAACYEDSHLATGVFSSNKGVLA